MTKPPSITLSKIDVVRRQLKHALELYFGEGDPLIVNILACAAHQVVHDLLAHQGKPSLFFDHEMIPKSERKKAATFLRSPYSFTKHADNDPNATLEFEPGLGAHFLFATVYGLTQLGETPTDLEEAFFWWWCILHPQVNGARSPVKVTVPEMRARDLDNFRTNARRSWPAVYIAHLKKPDSMKGVEVISSL